MRYGNNGRVAKASLADAHHVEGRLLVALEAGRGVINNQVLKDYFQACMMDDVEYLAVAVRNLHEAAGIKNRDFESVVIWFETFYASRRLELPLKGMLVLGY